MCSRNTQIIYFNNIFKEKISHIDKLSMWEINI